MAGLLEADAEAGREVVEVVFRGARLGEIGGVGHQHRGGVVVGELDPAAALLTQRGDAGAGEKAVERRPERQEAEHVHELEHPIRVIERLTEQDLARTFVVAAQGSGQLGDGEHPHRDPERAFQPQLHVGIEFVDLGRLAAPERLGGALELAKMVAVAAKEVVRRRLGPGRDDLTPVAAALGAAEQLVGGGLVGAVQLQESAGERRAMHERRAQLREIGRSPSKIGSCTATRRSASTVDPSSFAMSRHSTP